jgi:16S rRNA (uracil1498-N3)-methyltransferase
MSVFFNGDCMRVIRIYQAGEYQCGQLVELSPEAGQHVAVVLRRQVGDALVLFAGTDREFGVTIERIHKKQIWVRVDSVEEKSKESSLKIHLAQAISKGERMEWVMQKSVELGVTSITPLITDYCAVKLDEARVKKKMHQWQAIVVAACEQSGRNTVPWVHPPLTVDAYLTHVTAPVKLVLHPECSATWRDYSLALATDIALMVGPEGGFSEQELQHLEHHQFLPLSLGPRILRTETAALVALSVLQAVGGDL